MSKFYTRDFYNNFEDKLEGICENMDKEPRVAHLKDLKELEFT